MCTAILASGSARAYSERGRAAVRLLSDKAASYDGVPPDQTDQAAALLNAARNTGGSIGGSLISNVLSHREWFHQNRLVEHAIPQASNSGHAATGDELFRRAWRLSGPGAAAGDCLDWTAGAGAGVVPGLHGRLLGPDVGLACGRAARAYAAQDQVGGRRPMGHCKLLIPTSLGS
jgi:hypothetical protein